ncbi:unnamed protein product [Arctogadus glacialis]
MWMRARPDLSMTSRRPSHKNPGKVGARLPRGNALALNPHTHNTHQSDGLPHHPIVLVLLFINFPSLDQRRCMYGVLLLPPAGGIGELLPCILSLTTFCLR